MTKFLKNGNQGVVAQLCSLYVQTSISFAPIDLQKLINNHVKIFGEMPKGLPPIWDHDHDIICSLGVYHLTLGLIEIHMHKNVRLSV